MRKTCASIIAATFVLIGQYAHSGPATDKMGECLVKQSTGQDRIDLIRWIVFAYTSHPDVAPMFQVDPTAPEEINTKTARLFENLVGEKCLVESRDAFREDGDLAFQYAFEALGRIAAIELLGNEEVNRATSGFIDAIDDTKLEAVFE